MAMDRRRWDEDMAEARRAREIHKLASHRRNLARHQANHVRQTDGEGSNAAADDLM
jgi:hypothetical protein